MLQRENRNKRHIFFLPTRSYHSSIFSLAHQKPYLPYRRYGFVLNYAPSCTLSLFAISANNFSCKLNSFLFDFSTIFATFSAILFSALLQRGHENQPRMRQLSSKHHSSNTNPSRYCTFPRSDYSVRETNDRKRFRTT